MARPTKLTEDTERLVCAAIRNGSTIEAAAAVAGLDRITLYAWLRQGAGVIDYQARVDRGERIEPQYRRTLTATDRRAARFTHAVRRAQAELMTEQAMVIARAATDGAEKVVEVEKDVIDRAGNVVQLRERRVERLPGDWRAAAHLLAARFPKDWAPTTRTEVSGVDGGAIRVEATAAELVAKARALQSGIPDDDVVDAEVVDDDDFAEVRELLEG